MNFQTSRIESESLISQEVAEYPSQAIELAMNLSKIQTQQNQWETTHKPIDVRLLVSTRSPTIREARSVDQKKIFFPSKRYFQTSGSIRPYLILFLIVGFFLLSTSATVTYNCSNTTAFPNANITASPTAPSNHCVCKDGYFWFQPINKAENVPGNCAKCLWRAVTNQQVAHTNNTCICVPGWYWDQSLTMCRPNCTSVLNSTKRHSAYIMCECNIGLRFDPISLSCKTLNCSEIQWTDKDNSRASEGICNCENSSEMWNVTASFCEKGIQLQLQINVEERCTCQQSYLYSDFVLPNSCSQNYALIESFGIVEYWYYVTDMSYNPDVILSSDPSSCTCRPGYVWFPEIYNCKVNCSADNYANMTATQASISLRKCICLPTFFFNMTSLRCEINCSQVNFSNGVQLTYNSCVCAYPLTWNATGAICSLNCSNKSNVDNSARHPRGRCTCITEHAWSVTLGECIKAFACQTRNFTNLTFANNPLICTCIANFFWNATTLSCEINCTKIKGADLTATNTATDSCICRSPSYFNTTSKLCVINCRNVPFTNTSTSYVPRIVTCLCLNKYFWNEVTLSCDLNCSLVTYADPSVPNPTPTSCVCTAGTNWNSTDGLCWVNCSNITNGKASLGPTTCSCVSKSYVWNSTARTCVINCSSVPFYAAPPPGSLVPTDACTCQPFFVWDAASWKCLINCTGIYGVLPGSTRLTDSSCRCVRNFYWAPGFMACLPICTKFARSNGLPTVSKRACQCNPGFTWKTPEGCV